ncbi:MAG: hypothetical protein PVS2B3_12270 [Steroidobacteraceae bacterium]
MIASSRSSHAADAVSGSAALSSKAATEEEVRVFTASEPTRSARAAGGQTAQGGGRVTALHASVFAAG